MSEVEDYCLSPLIFTSLCMIIHAQFSSFPSKIWLVGVTVLTPPAYCWKMKTGYQIDYVHVIPLSHIAYQNSLTYLHVSDNKTALTPFPHQVYYNYIPGICNRAHTYTQPHTYNIDGARWPR